MQWLSDMKKMVVIAVVIAGNSKKRVIIGLFKH